VVRLWDLETGHGIAELADNPPAYYARLHFAPDGRALIVSHRDGLRLWEVATRRERLFLKAQTPAGFSRNGRFLYCLAENRVTVWDLTGQKLGKAPVRLGAEELAARFADLQGADAWRAYQAIWELAANAEQAVPLLAEKVKTAPDLDRRRIPVLVADLDHEEFARRERAAEQLLKLGCWSQGALQEVLAKKPALEMRQRVERLLVRLREQPYSTEQVLGLRVVEVLERSAAPEARRLLETLAHSSKPQFNEAAQQALARLGR
jgi:hypothetical protein